MLPVDTLVRMFLQVPAITSGGAVAAEWVMVGVTTAAIFLFWRMLWKIETGLDKVIMSVQVHNTKLELHQKCIEDLEEDMKLLKDKTRKR